MTVLAEEQGAPARYDRLISFRAAALALGTTPETLRIWYAQSAVPAVISPGGTWQTYESWVAAVLRSARPGQAGRMADVTAAWFAEHIPEAVA